MEGCFMKKYRAKIVDFEPVDGILGYYTPIFQYESSTGQIERIRGAFSIEITPATKDLLYSITLNKNATLAYDIDVDGVVGKIVFMFVLILFLAMFSMWATLFVIFVFLAFISLRNIIRKRKKQLKINETLKNATKIDGVICGYCSLGNRKSTFNQELYHPVVEYIYNNEKYYHVVTKGDLYSGEVGIPKAIYLSDDKKLALTECDAKSIYSVIASDLKILFFAIVLLIAVIIFYMFTQNENTGYELIFKIMEKLGSLM